jgi:hypothetical protein
MPPLPPAPATLVGVGANVVDPGPGVVSVGAGVGEPGIGLPVVGGALGWVGVGLTVGLADVLGELLAECDGLG